MGSIPKTPKKPGPDAGDEGPAVLWDLARFALVLTGGTALATLIVVPFHRGPEVVTLAATLFGVFVTLIWGASTVIGVIVVLPGTVWRLVQRIVRKRRRERATKSRLRDDWLDGPDTT